MLCLGLIQLVGSLLNSCTSNSKCNYYNHIIYQFITCSSDEVTAVDNNSWIYVHAYVVDCWTGVRILVCVYKIVDVLGFNNFIELIMNAMMKGGGLTKEDLSKKFLCFEVDEMNVFQHGKTNVTKEIKILWHLFPWVPLCCS